MNFLLCSLASALCLLSFSGCGNIPLGPDGKPVVHGSVSTSYTQEMNDPKSGKVTVGGQIMFLRRPVTLREKADMHDTAVADGIAYATAPDGDQEHARFNCVRRLSYKYRIKASEIRPYADRGFQEGVDFVKASQPTQPESP